MEKIVILSDASKGNSPLEKSLKKLFPKCEIRIVPTRHENAGAVPTLSNHEGEKIESHG